MRVVGIVQARTGSRRLPGKVLMDVGGRPMIAQILLRVAQAERLDEVVLATSDGAADDPLAELAAAEGFRCVRGSEADVLGRFVLAARETGADAVVRVTGDCPLIDPGVIDDVVGELAGHPCDYASNVLRRTFPRGLDAEALHADVLSRIDRLATSAEAREHVTWFAYSERPELFVLRSVEHAEDYSELDWSVDTEEDLELVRELYDLHGLADGRVSWRELV